jgi:hypothetical protein
MDFWEVWWREDGIEKILKIWYQGLETRKDPSLRALAFLSLFLISIASQEDSTFPLSAAFQIPYKVEENRLKAAKFGPTFLPNFLMTIFESL